MLRFSLTFADSENQRRIASLRIYFPYDEFASLDFADAGQLIALLRAFKQEGLISRAKRLLVSSDLTEKTLVSNC